VNANDEAVVAVEAEGSDSGMESSGSNNDLALLNSVIRPDGPLFLLEAADEDAMEEVLENFDALDTFDAFEEDVAEASPPSFS